MSKQNAADRASSIHVLHPDRPPLKGGDGGGISGDMETRVKRLEDDSKEIRADLKKLLSDVAEIKGRVSSMPTSLQLFLGVMGIFAASGLLRWFGH